MRAGSGSPFIMFSIITSSIGLLSPISLQCRKLDFHLRLFVLEQFDALAQCICLFLCADTQFFHDLDDAPETKDNNQRSNLFEYTVQQDIDDEAGHNDSGIKAVKL